MTAEVRYDGFGSWLVADDHAIVGYYGSPELARAACAAHNTRSAYRVVTQSNHDEWYAQAQAHVAAKTAGEWWSGLTADERGAVATAVAQRNSLFTWRQAHDRFDALAAEWQAAQVAQAARTLPPVGALCEALTTLAAAAPMPAYARACVRAAAHVVAPRTTIDIDSEGDLVIGSASEPGRVWRVNAHGCTCRAKHGACWHTALWDAVQMVWDEEAQHDA